MVDGAGGSGQGETGLHARIALVGAGLSVRRIREADPVDGDIVGTVDDEQLFGVRSDGLRAAHVLALARQVGHGAAGRVPDELARLVKQFGSVLEECDAAVAAGVDRGGVPGGPGAVGAARRVGPAGPGEGHGVAADARDPAVVVAPADPDDGLGVGGALPPVDSGGGRARHPCLGRVARGGRAGIAAGTGRTPAVDEELARGDAVGDSRAPGAVGVLPPARDVLSAGEDGAGAGGGGPGDAGVGGAEREGSVEVVRAVLQEYADVAPCLGAGQVPGAFGGAGAEDGAGGAVAVGGRVQGAGTGCGLGSRGGEERGQEDRGGGGGGGSYAVHGAVHAAAFQSGWPGMGGLTAPKSQSRRNGSTDRSPVTSTACRMKASLV